MVEEVSEYLSQTQLFFIPPWPNQSTILLISAETREETEFMTTVDNSNEFPTRKKPMRFKIYKVFVFAPSFPLHFC